MAKEDNAVELLLDVTMKLESLEYAFTVIGNEAMSTAMFESRLKIEKAITMVNEERRQMVDKGIQDAQAMSSAIMSLALNPEKIRA